MSSPTPNPAPSLDLSTDPSLTITDKTKVTQANNIRNTMNVNNILSPVNDTPDVPAAPVVTAPVASAPSTPIKCIKEEVSSPDTVMSELVSLNIYSLSYSPARPSSVHYLMPETPVCSNAIR